MTVNQVRDCGRVERMKNRADVESKKVKFSHTRYRALGPELIPVYM